MPKHVQIYLIHYFHKQKTTLQMNKIQRSDLLLLQIAFPFGVYTLMHNQYTKAKLSNSCIYYAVFTFHCFSFSCSNSCTHKKKKNLPSTQPKPLILELLLFISPLHS